MLENGSHPEKCISTLHNYETRGDNYLDKHRTPLFQGFSVTASLIIAIGAQNAFVLKQGIKRKHLWLTIAICIVSDILLISAGVFGFGYLVEVYPNLMFWFGVFGASFLIAYGLNSWFHALRPKAIENDTEITSQRAIHTVMALLAFTFLNPHTYLDTVVLIGSAGAQYADKEQLVFLIGCVVASSIWFISLSFGAAKLAPYFQNPKTWQKLHGAMGLIMMVIAFSLLYPLIP